MTKLLFTGILSAVLVAGVLSMYVPNALSTILEDPFEDCINNGNSALAQKDSNNDAEQGTGQTQSDDGSISAQSVSPQFNGLTGNNLNLDDQQNGECIEPFDDDGGVGVPV